MDEIDVDEIMNLLRDFIAKEMEELADEVTSIRNDLDETHSVLEMLCDDVDQLEAKLGIPPDPDPVQPN